MAATTNSSERITTSQYPGQFYDPPAMDQQDIDAMLSYGVTPPSVLMQLQERANARAQAQRKRSEVASLTYEEALADAHEALVGITEDLSGATERKGLKDMLTHNNRLRGLGILLIVLALVGLVVDYIMAPRIPIPIPGPAS